MMMNGLLSQDPADLGLFLGADTWLACLLALLCFSCLLARPYRAAAATPRPRRRIQKHSGGGLLLLGLQAFSISIFPLADYNTQSNPPDPLLMSDREKKNPTPVDGFVESGVWTCVSNALHCWQLGYVTIRWEPLETVRKRSWGRGWGRGRGGGLCASASACNAYVLWWV